MASHSYNKLAYNGSSISVSEKLERTFAIQQELIDSLKTHGCPNCLRLLREIVKKYGGMSDSSQTSQNRTSEGDGPFDILDTTR